MSLGLSGFSELQNKFRTAYSFIQLILAILACAGQCLSMPTLAIVSPPPDDRPIFEATFPQAVVGKHNIIEQLVLNSSLDMVDEAVST